MSTSLLTENLRKTGESGPGFTLRERWKSNKTQHAAFASRFHRIKSRGHNRSRKRLQQWRRQSSFISTASSQSEAAMQQQRKLFDESEQAGKLSRKSDPITSHEAAVNASANRTETQRRCLECLTESKVPLCANRLATRCCKRYGCEGNDKQKRTIWENYRKRSHEIFRDATLTVESGKENGSRVFRAKDQK